MAGYRNGIYVNSAKPVISSNPRRPRCKKILEDVRRAYRKKVLFTSHVLEQMNLAESLISRLDVYDAIESDELVEDYPNDPRGRSCLIMGKTRNEQFIRSVLRERSTLR